MHLFFSVTTNETVSKVQFSSTNSQHISQINLVKMVLVELSSELIGLNSILDLTTFKIGHGIGTFLNVSITLFCYTGFIHYEYFGGDPMKRSK